MRTQDDVSTKVALKEEPVPRLRLHLLRHDRPTWFKLVQPADTTGLSWVVETDDQKEARFDIRLGSPVHREFRRMAEKLNAETADDCIGWHVLVRWQRGSVLYDVTIEVPPRVLPHNQFKDPP